jgi:capsular exopolysaccharide synthesis family protein
VLDEAIRRSHVEEKYGVHYAASDLAKKLTTLFNEGPELLQVTLADDDPEAVAALLEALAVVYPAKIQAADEERVRTRIAQLRDRLEINPKKPDTGRLTEQLREKRAELQKAEKDAGLDDAATLGEKYRHALTQLTVAQRDRSAKQSQRRTLEFELAHSKKRMRGPASDLVSDIEAEESLRNKLEYQTLMGKIEVNLEGMERDRKNTTGELRQKQMAKWTRALRPLRERQRELLEDEKERLAEKVRKMDRRAIARLEGELEHARTEEQTLEGEVRRWSREVETLKAGGPKAPPEVEALRDQLGYLVKEAGTVGDALAALEASLPIPPRVTVHTRPFVATKRDLNKPIKIAGGLGVLAFLGALAGLCLLESTRRRVSSADEVSQGLGLRVVGTLPRLPPAARQKSAGAQVLGGLDARYGLTEAVDALRTVLLHSPRLDGARVVAVTSAIGGEGKTTLASHLAASLARAWRKTLLIDGDLRKPAAHQQFDLPLEPGLSEALRGDIEFEDTIKPTMTGRLWLMPAGKVDAHSLQALAQDGLASVFERLKEQYDFIILDTSPVLPVPDALLLAQQADTVLLSVLRDHSRLPAVYAAGQKLEALGIHVLGSVVIGERTETYGHAVPYPQS